MITDIREKRRAVDRPVNVPVCEHRRVAGDGRIVCIKIAEGDAEVSPNVCRDCPFKAVDCRHLRFSLRLISPSPLIVRFNGREELWDDGPSELQFERAACSERVMPIHGVGMCTECALREPLHTASESAVRELGAAGRTPGAVVAFPGRKVVAAAG